MVSEDDAKLLTRLLSATKTTTRLTPLDDGILLRRLLDGAPKNLHGQRCSTLFDALDVLNLENPHSDFIAWLLDPRGPLSKNWLLRALLNRVAPEQLWPSDDPVVEREVDVNGGRLDIRVTWDAFSLIIENKVWSREGTDQVARYLPEIRTAADGRLIYLSPFGYSPDLIHRVDKRVISMSYVELMALVQDGIAAEREERGRVFATEFCNCVKRLLKIRYDMSKPEVSESTKIYLGNAQRLSEIKSIAIDESSNFFSGCTRRSKGISSQFLERESLHIKADTWSCTGCRTG